MVKEDLEMALGKEIKCEGDLVYKDFIKEATFWKSLVNGTDIAAEELNEDVPEKLQSLLHEPEKQHEDALSQKEKK